MVIFNINNQLNDFIYIGSSYLASPDGSRTPVSFSFRQKKCLI
jgi:hypothetical protein